MFYTYSNFPSNPIFSDFSKFILELKRIRGNYFKDDEKKLINALIQFFKWRVSNQSDLILATSKFDTYWESMVEVFLNGKFSRIDPITDKIEWTGEFKTKRKKFFKPDKEPIEASKPKNANYGIGGRKIQFDHFHINRYMFPINKRILYEHRNKEICSICKGLRRKREHFIQYKK